jgi:hypothetical protein
MRARPPLPDDIKQLMALVRAGRLFDVQKWIAEGKRTVPPKPYWFSPLRVAIETGFHSMVEVLLQSGIEQEEKDYLLNRVVWNAKLELIKLFVNYGADIQSVDFEDVCWSGNPEITRFFLDRGIDAVTGHPFAKALCHPKRPQLGIYMQYRDKIPELKYQLNLALRHHAREGSLKWVCLLLWAGGNAHVRLPDVDEESDPEDNSTALEEAVRFGRQEIVEKIGIDPKRDDLNRLLEEACSKGAWPVIEQLLTLGADQTGGLSGYPPMERLINHFAWQINPWVGYRSESNLQEAFNLILSFADKGGRWCPKEKYGVNGFRRDLYHLDAKWIEKVFRGFQQHLVCSTELLLKLLNTPRMKEILGERFPKLVTLLKQAHSYSIEH